MLAKKLRKNAGRDIVSAPRPITNVNFYGLTAEILYGIERLSWLRAQHRG
jgi:hypothetical protein